MACLIHRTLKGFTFALLTVLCTAGWARADLVYAWGSNSSGQVGDGTTTDVVSPVALSTLSSGVTAIAGGGFHSLAIQNGGVYAWGYNVAGQLGDSTTTDRHAPGALTGTLSSGVTAIAGGYEHSLAMRNGGVYAWGYNSAGELGDGTMIDHHVPAAIAGILSGGVSAIAAGGGYSLALRNGSLYAWGNNFQGELGDGTQNNSPTPKALTGALSSGVTGISAGAYHGMAIQNGGVYTWGYNLYGQLGDGSTTNRLTPVTLTGALSSGVTAVAGGYNHSLAIRNGGVYAWGNNGNGQLGDGTITDQHTPEQIDPADLHNIVAIAASQFSSFALSADGSLWTWGDNGYGELGLGNNTEFHTPQHRLPPSGYVFTSISANSIANHVVATLTPTPEPASLSLLALGGIALFRRNRR